VAAGAGGSVTVLRLGGGFARAALGHTYGMSKSVKRGDMISLDEERIESRRDRDGVSSLRDTEAESGDEDGVTDRFDLDSAEARDLGVALDRTGGETPLLD
jgi:hypothetical protein